ncbi:hypothetical protein E2C01_016775 [Portunus trituberculatus]|uniref:Uncharacterized protein n=1 Tax=Portunus trituberculatus TaxID=210409 RepID=A0A5B7DR52_PORTR|nr:hypothetical protein [Portunus trituberculatus]
MWGRNTRDIKISADIRNGTDSSAEEYQHMLAVRHAGQAAAHAQSEIVTDFHPSQTFRDTGLPEKRTSRSFPWSTPWVALFPPLKIVSSRQNGTGAGFN